MRQINACCLFRTCVGKIQNSAYIHKDSHNKDPPKAGFCYNNQTMDTNLNARQPGFFRKIISAENITHTVLTLLLVLVPVFFIPSFLVTTAIAKSVFVSIGIILAFASYAIVLIRKGSFSFSKNPIAFASMFVLLAYLVSSIFSTSSRGSFLGYGFEITTFVAILLGFVLMHLVSTSYFDSKKIFFGHIAFLSVAGVLVLFQTLLILINGTSSLSDGGFLMFIANTIGKTNELAIFFGISALLSLCALETLRIHKLHRIILYVILCLSFVVIAVVNFLTVWYVLGCMLLLLSVYHVTFLNAQSRLSVVSSEASGVAVGGNAEPVTRLQSSRKKIPVRTAVFLAISLLFIVPSFFGQNVGQRLSEKFGFNSLEVRPSWSATSEIFKNTISQSTLVGAGPNRFFTQWQLFRPDVNMTNFWSVDFDFGIGYIPTAFVETGILGIVGWFVFLLSILYVGFRALYARTADQTTRYLVTSSFVSTLFLWILNVLYTPSSVLLTLSFFFTGLFAASALLVGVGERTTVFLVGRPKVSFVAIAVSVCLLIAGLGLGYVLVERARASVYFQGANNAVNKENDLVKAESLLFRSIDIAPNDVYYRMVANLSITRINNLLAASAGKTEVTDAEKNEFQIALQNAAQAIQLANDFDPLNFQNKMIAGRVYETIVPVQIEGAYEMSKKLYDEAVALSPRNPALFLALARVEATKGNLDAAEEYVKKTLVLKWNYPDAIFLQSQIDVSRGNVPSAIRSVQQIAALTPDDPLIYFRLGLLQYEAKNFTQAIAAFEKSISLVPVYANAKYFLGLSYEKAGRTADAVKTFTELKSTNPEVTELGQILTNIQAGRDPFADDAENVDPEKRKELPVKETASSETP